MIFAGADSVLIPSRYEPCGLVQMESMRYGAVPIVRKTGGLADSVDDYDPKKDAGTGFVFEHYNGFALYGAIMRMLEHYKNPRVWAGIQKRAMMADFSWDNSAREYVKLFERAIIFHNQQS
jgi:starch synthase